jgi:two-component system phosphate regulon response regulator OmpR
MASTNEIEDFAALPHILVVDDDDRIRDLVSRYLTEHGFFVSAAEDAAMAAEILALAAYDALVLDVMMPGKNGVDFTEELRAMDSELADMPILLLTAMGEADDRVSGLAAGADDYLAKPFDPRELVLRLKAILRRKPKYKTEIKAMFIGPWKFDYTHNELISDAETVKLTDGEANLLKALCAEAGEVVEREDLAEACGLDADKRTVDVQVTRLRRKLEQDTNNPRFLQTVRGKGYLLRAQLSGGQAQEMQKE